LIVNITNAPTVEALEAELAEAEAEAGIEPTLTAPAEPTEDEAPAESESA
jgi:large subunit ribosomal protein L25